MPRSPDEGTCVGADADDGQRALLDDEVPVLGRPTQTWKVGRGLLVLALTAAADLAFVFDIGRPLQPLLIAVFLVMAPGAAALSRMTSWPPVVWMTAVIATSLSIDSLLTAALFYAHAWSPGAVMICLSLWCIACAAPGALREAGAVLGRQAGASGHGAAPR
jgi:hypothetical protein